MSVDWYGLAGLASMVVSAVVTAIVIYVGLVFVIGGWG